VSTSIVQTTQNPLLEAVYTSIKREGDLGRTRIFDGLYTAIAISESGFVGVYYPHIPYKKKFFIFPEWQEQPEHLELIHISQINSFDVDIDGDETIKQSTGLAGALVGGLIGGTTGAIIGSTARSGTTKVDTKIHNINLIINTKDFGNPRIVVPLYKGKFTISYWDGILGFSPSYWGTHSEIKLNKYTTHYGVAASVVSRKFYKKILIPLFETVYNNGEPPIDNVRELLSHLELMLSAHKESQMSAVTSSSHHSSADELNKFKGLLDSGVITQEEFNAKKKQLLGID